MSIPLDNLYNWVEGVSPHPAVLYVFHPHGSKNISDCNRLRDYDPKIGHKLPVIICNDQEPLDWDFYNQPNQVLGPVKKVNEHPLIDSLVATCCSGLNLKTKVYWSWSTIYDNVILLHSEKNSTDLAQYQKNGFLCVHYWAHAVIARDWYRFAEHDTRLKTNAQSQNLFLIYCRDWSHRREYRLKFLEMLIQHNLHDISQTSVMHTNSEGVHFSQHPFENSSFELTAPDLLYQIHNNNLSSTSSADYDYADFINNKISVVLETVFDDDRIHLTEKTLRPIACGHPFILVGGAGSLEYIKSYGFKTFAPWIDESYDQETDSLKRLEKIIKSMKQIQSLQGQELEDFSREVKRIADFNKKHFFSDEFFNQVTAELKNNLDQAYGLAKQTRGKYYLRLLKTLKRHGVIMHLPGRKEKTQFVRQLRQSYPIDPSNPPQDFFV
tara:strand:+ start:80 stop:1393 length:1314 start_codon:yes stop_codon:yes gene_type:complete